MRWHQIKSSIFKPKSVGRKGKLNHVFGRFVVFEDLARHLRDFTLLQHVHRIESDLELGSYIISIVSTNI